MPTDGGVEAGARDDGHGPSPPPRLGIRGGHIPLKKGSHHILIASDIENMPVAALHALRPLMSHHELHITARRHAELSAADVAEAEIILTDPPKFGAASYLDEDAEEPKRRAPKLRWLQSTFAGVDALFQPGRRR